MTPEQRKEGQRLAHWLIYEGANCQQHVDAGMLLRALAAEPVGEPVAWMHNNASGFRYFRKKPQDRVFNPQPVYLHPPQNTALREAAQAVIGWAATDRMGRQQIPESVIEQLRAALEAK